MSSALRALTALVFPVMLLGATPVAAQGLALDSIVELERSSTAADGTALTEYVKPETVVPGDRVRITLRYENRGRVPVNSVRLNNPIPDGLQYDGTRDVQNFSLSINGGASWGQLADLTLLTADGTPRAATAEDVTHVLWVLPEPVAPGARGSVSFFARVR